MRKLKSIALSFSVLVGSAGMGLLSGCAPVVPRELADARFVYQRAQQGPAQQVAPAELHKAAEALAAAEAAFADKPEAQTTRDLAYVAERKAQLAEAIAAQAVDNKTKASADNQFQKEQTGQLNQTRDQLAASRALGKDQANQIGQEQQGRMNAEDKAANAESRAATSAQKSADADQRAADADARAKAAQDALAKLAAVKEEQRGLVITLSGSVLFASDKAVLLPEAQTRLNQVGDALMATKERNLVIEGHTDSKGSQSHNVELSQKRADAVREYLVSRGYGAGLIVARGLGDSRPIANNGSPEGRANNRRVEIIVEPKRVGAN